MTVGGTKVGMVVYGMRYSIVDIYEDVMLSEDMNCMRLYEVI